MLIKGTNNSCYLVYVILGGDSQSTFQDLFWSFIAPRLSPGFNVAPPEIAIDFAWELYPRVHYEQFGQLPFGCHAWQRYDRAFWIDILRTLDADTISN